MSSRIEIDGIVADVRYVPWNDGSYVASIGIARPGSWPLPLIEKSFGNGVRAEDWILEELSLPKSLLILKYSK